MQTTQCWIPTLCRPTILLPGCLWPFFQPYNTRRSPLTKSVKASDFFTHLWPWPCSLYVCFEMRLALSQRGYLVPRASCLVLLVSVGAAVAGICEWVLVAPPACHIPFLLILWIFNSCCNMFHIINFLLFFTILNWKSLWDIICFGE